MYAMIKPLIHYLRYCLFALLAIHAGAAYASCQMAPGTGYEIYIDFNKTGSGAATNQNVELIGVGLANFVIECNSEGTQDNYFYLAFMSSLAAGKPDIGIDEYGCKIVPLDNGTGISWQRKVNDLFQCISLDIGLNDTAKALPLGANNSQNHIMEKVNLYKINSDTQSGSAQPQFQVGLYDEQGDMRNPIYNIYFSSDNNPTTPTCDIVNKNITVDLKTHPLAYFNSVGKITAKVPFDLEFTCTKATSPEIMFIGDNGAYDDSQGIIKLSNSQVDGIGIQLFGLDSLPLTLNQLFPLPEITAAEPHKKYTFFASYYQVSNVVTGAGEAKSSATFVVRYK